MDTGAGSDGSCECRQQQAPDSASLYGDMTSPRETQQVGKTMELGRGQKPSRKTEKEKGAADN